MLTSVMAIIKHSTPFAFGKEGNMVTWIQLKAKME
jgi:hypothetical protein